MQPAVRELGVVLKGGVYGERGLADVRVVGSGWGAQDDGQHATLLVHQAAAQASRETLAQKICQHWPGQPGMLALEPSTPSAKSARAGSEGEPRTVPSRARLAAQCPVSCRPAPPRWLAHDALTFLLALFDGRITAVERN